MPRKRIQRGHIAIRWPDGSEVKLEVDEREVKPAVMADFKGLCDHVCDAMWAKYEQNRLTRDARSLPEKET